VETEPAETSQARWAVAPPTTLLREFLRVSDDFERRLGRDLGVNPTDLQAMEHLIESGPLSPSEIAARLGVTTAAATTIVDRLTRVGHVHRQSNEHDRRGVLVVPEPGSIRRALGVIMPMVQEVDGALRDFDEAEQRAITAYLERVLEIYRTHAGGDPA
jgi:DNA-binding MarR family transcriptional regulator